MYTFTALGRKLDEIRQISLKLPGNAIVIVCKRCSDLIAKVEKLETELDATRGRIMQLVTQLAQRLQRRNRILSPSATQVPSTVTRIDGKVQQQRSSLFYIHSIIARGSINRDNWRCDFGCRQFHWSSWGVKLIIVARPYFASLKGGKLGIAGQTTCPQTHLDRCIAESRHILTMHLGHK